MTWFKVDDDFFAHRKVVGLSDAAVALWTRAGSWCSRNLTDGFVPTAALALLTRAPQQAPAELIDRGLWRRARGGFQFHDWSEYQPTAEAEINKRRVRAEAGRKGGLASGKTRSKTEANASAKGKQTGSESEPRTRTQEPSPNGEASPGAQARARRIPDDFAVSDEMVAWAREHTPLVGRTETANFIDYWTAASGRTASKLDWVASWRTWMRKAQTDAERRRPGAAPAANGQPTSGSKRMDKALAALAPDDPFRAEYAATQAAVQQPTDWLMIEGGQPA